MGAALERGALAIDEFLTAMRQRRAEYDDLMDRRQRLNADQEALAARASRPRPRTRSRRCRPRPPTSASASRPTARTSSRGATGSTPTSRRPCGRCPRSTSCRRARLRPPPARDTEALAAELRRLGTDTDAVNAWWNGLSQAERNALMISDPDLVGNTNGIPTGDRDEANTSAVQRDVEYLLGLQASGQDLSASQERWLENAQSIEKAVAQASDPKWADLGVDAFVMAYQPHAFGGDGIAAVAYGDPDTADHTAVYVPGIMQDGTQIDENGAQALNLYEETVNSMLGEDPPRPGSVSTIAWIGYDSPNFNPESMWPWDLGDSGGDVAAHRDRGQRPGRRRRRCPSSSTASTAPTPAATSRT